MIIKNMGPRWLYHRLLHSLKLKTNYFDYIEYKYAYVNENLNFRSTKNNLLSFKNENIIDKNILNKIDNNKKSQVINSADKIIDNTFEYFFIDEFTFGQIDWHFNPYNNRSIPPNKKWYEIPMHDLKNGDIKDYWEINRFVFVYDLINAYSLTSDEKYAKKFIDLVTDWIGKNPFEYGVNYKCSQETSFRCLNWIMGIMHLDLIENHPITTNEILESILKQSYHVKSLMSYSVNCVKNNHTLNEAMFLYVIGNYFSFSDNNNFAHYGRKIYNEALNEQILSDGSYIQNSHTYHRVMLLSSAMFKYFEKNDGDLNINSIISLNKAIDFMKSFIMDNGDMPNYGPNDGSIPFNFTLNNYRDFRPIIDIMCQILNGYQYYETNESHINAWFNRFLGDLSIKSKKKNSLINSKYFREGGYLILVKDNKKLFMRIKDGKRRPGQPDNNSIDLWNEDKNLLIDTGTYKYTTEEHKIDYFKGSTGHNYMRVNRQEPMKRISKFMYSNWSKSEIEELNVNNNYIKVKNLDYNSFDIYRSIKLDNNLIIKDTINPYFEEEYNIEIFFHINSIPELITHDKFKVVFKMTDGNIIKFMSNESIEYDLFYGEEEPFRGWKSTHYNRLEKNYQIVIRLNSHINAYVETEYIFRKG